MSRLARVGLWAGLVVLAGFVLAAGASVVLPAIEAVALWFVLNALADALRRVPVLGPRLGRLAALSLAATLVLLLGGLVVASVARTAAELHAGLPAALASLGERAALRLGLGPDAAAVWLASAVRLEDALAAAVLATAALVSQAGLVAVYAAFLLVDQRFFPAKLRLLVPDPGRRAETEALLRRLGAGIRAYLWVMTKASLITAILAFAVMRLAGMDAALFLAVAIFFLNYIPTVGSILGTVVPVAFALLQFPTLGPVALVLAGVGAVQVVVGNVVLPRMAGTSLNISLFVTLFSLFAFGALWGVTGMFVALPLTGALMIVLANFEATRPVAVLLSRTGDVSGLTVPPHPADGRAG